MSSAFSVFTPSPSQWKRITGKSPIFLLQFAIVSLAMMLCLCQASNQHPIILVPGSGGNQLEARLTSDYKPSGLFCDRWNPIRKDKDGWFRLWFDPSIILAPFTRCFADRMMLYYDTLIHDYKNAPGVETRVPYFGSTKSLLYLNPYLKRITAYMGPLVKTLEEMGYVDGENLFGAPYDFRYGLSGKGNPSRVGTNFLNDLQNLIEHASDLNDGDKVIIISHSLGGLFVNQLLSRNSVTWRKRYIKHFISLSAPWGGTVDQMRTFASGNTMGIPFANPLIVRNEQRSSESNLWLLPSPKIFTKGKFLVTTKNATYSGSDIARFLQDIGAAESGYLYKSRILPLVRNFGLPDKIHATCIIGSGVKTPEKLIYGESGFDEQPDVAYGDGDGTVNMISLMALDSDGENNGKHKSVRVIKLEGVNHAAIIKDHAAIRKIIGVIHDVNSDRDSPSSALRTQ